MFVPLPPAAADRSANYDLVKTFCNANFWEEDWSGLFAVDVTADFPHAPPGMLQHMDAFEFGAFRYWLRNTVIKMAPAAEPAIIPTTDPAVFIAVRYCRGEVYWAKKTCAYENEHAMKIVLRDGKIAYLKDYFNPLAFYRSLDICLPAFIYDTDEGAENCRMPEGVPSALTEEVNRRRIMDNFLNPIDFDAALEPIYAAAVQMVCPNAPFNMPVLYEGKVFDQNNKWMFENCSEMVGQKNVPYYVSPDGKWLIIESNCYLKTAWSWHEGHYTQRELYIVYIEKGKIKHFRVYFNSLNKFSSMNQSVPSFPYFNF